jgi:hypothetical protein
MRGMILMLLLLTGGTRLASGAQEEAVTDGVQLIRGTDAVTPPTPEARLVGPELDHRLQMFKWRNYWEISHRAVVLKPGAKTRQRLTPQSEVEIALTTPGNMTVSIYTNGQLSRRRNQAADTAFFIAGGDHDNSECWFIVVRHDNPEAEQASLK